jgi:nitrous oxidase accessory protein
VIVSIPEINVVQAEAQMIVVPDDYATIQEAIDTASEGDTIFVKKGTYEGPVNQTLMINKTITLIGEDAENTIINLYPPYNVLSLFPNPPVLFYSDAIVINANNVKLEGLTIVSTPDNHSVGYILVNGNSTQIIDCIITKGITLTSYSNTVTGNKMGYRFTLENTSSNVIVGNSIAEYFYMEYADLNVINNNTCWGFVIGYSGHNTISRNILSGNAVTRSAIRLYNSGTNNVFHDNYIANYSSGIGGVGVNFGTNAVNNTFYRNTLINNRQNAESSMSGNYWDNGVEGNYWDDYNGTDNDGDGIGDTPYIINENNQDNYPLMAPIKTFDAGTWEWTQYNVDIISNSTLSDFSFNPEGALIRYTVIGETGTTGFCRVTIPKDLLYADVNWLVLVNGTSVTPIVNEDINNTYLYFTYQHSTKTVEIIGTTAIPEFPSWTLLPLFAIVTLAVVICRNRLRKKVAS